MYRRFFVDLELVARNFPEIGAGKHLLDIGGGDGELINHLARRFPTLKVTMMDIASKIGNFVEAQYLNNVEMLPATSMADYRGKYLSNNPIDYILVSDVIHHVPPAHRPQFFKDLALLVNNGTTIIIKDIEPGYIKSKLSYWADKYISGDKTVSLTSRKEAVDYMKIIFPQINYYETKLLSQNRPNFCMVFTFTAALV